MTEQTEETCAYEKYIQAAHEVIASDFTNLPFFGKYCDFPKNIVVLGCGGTGSWFAPKLVKMINDALRKSLISRSGSKIEIVFVDGDVV